MIRLNIYSSNNKIIISADHLVHNLVLQSFHKLYQLNKDFVAPHKNNSNKKTFYKNQKTKSYPHRKTRSLKHIFYSDISHLLMCCLIKEYECTSCTITKTICEYFFLNFLVSFVFCITNTINFNFSFSTTCIKYFRNEILILVDHR